MVHHCALGAILSINSGKMSPIVTIDTQKGVLFDHKQPLKENDDAIQKGREPARMFVDGLVKAIEVKANVNMTAVKMMEANSKMLAAIKASGGIQVNNQNLSVVNNHDLEQILDQPMTHEDEF